MSATTLSHWPGPDVDMMGLQWHTISAIVPSLGHFTSSLNAGLSGATLYDTVQADGVIGNATEDATTFRAECGLLRNSDFSFIPELNANQFGNYVVDPQVSGRQQTMKWLARLVPPYQDQLAACESVSLIFPGSTIVFMMSIDVDDSLKSATVQHMNWEYQPDGPQAPIISTVLDTHLIACNMYVERHTATVDMGTGQLLALFPPLFLSPPSDWKVWTAPKGDDTWDTWSFPRAGEYNNYPVNMGNLYKKWVSRCYITDRDDTGAKLGSNAGGFDPTRGSSVISRQVTKWRLNINLWPLVVALSASLIMLILSIYTPGGMHRQKSKTPIYSTGVLQIIWLTNRLRVLKDLMREVDDPREDVLRSAGMLEVNLLQELNTQE